MKHVVMLKWKKETKNTVVFEEVHEPTAHAVMGTQYMSKPAWAQIGSPTEIVVTIEPVLAVVAHG